MSNILLANSFIFSFLVSFFMCGNAFYKKGVSTLSTIRFSILWSIFFLIIFLSFGSLIYNHLFTNLSLVYTLLYSNASDSLFYKIGSLWSGHDGSFFLWYIFQCSFFLLLSIQCLSLDVHYFKIVSGVVTLFIAILCIVSFFSSNIFNTVDFCVIDGVGLSPLLRDLLLLIHPPVIFSSIASSLILFACVVGIFVRFHSIRMQFSAYIDLLFFWTRYNFVAQTIGIGLGSYWAYHELGWGGWWFWDPVELVSLLPWLISVLMLHIVHLLRKGINNSTILLTLCYATALSFTNLISTFLVRSNLLHSVHSFAGAGYKAMLFLLLVFVCVYLSIRVFHQKNYNFLGQFGSVILLYKTRASRDAISLFFFCMLVLFVSIYWFLLFFSLLYPILYEWLCSITIILNYGYYANLCGVLILPFISFMVVGSIAHYAIQFSIKSSIVVITFFCVCSVYIHTYAQYTLYYALLLSILLIGIISTVFFMYAGSRSSRGLYAHFFFYLIISAVVYSKVTEYDLYLLMHLGEHIRILNNDIIFSGMFLFDDYTYSSLVASFTSYLGESNTISCIDAYPERRYYSTTNLYSSKVSIIGSWLVDYYFVLGNGNFTDGWPVQLTVRFFMLFVWISFFCILCTFILFALFRLRQYCLLQKLINRTFLYEKNISTKLYRS